MATRWTRYRGWSSVRSSGVPVPFTSGPRRRERRSLGVRHVVERGVLAQLERADVERDGPAVGHGDLLRVVGHDAEAVRDGVEEVAVGCLAQAVDVERRRLAVAALHNHAVTGPDPVVAGRAEDVVALVAARENL